MRTDVNDYEWKANLAHEGIPWSLQTSGFSHGPVWIGLP